MEPIILTEEQRSNLLDMCWGLFGNHKIELDYDSGEFTGFLKIKDKVDYIHWFEFCSRYLMSKLDTLYFEKVMYPVDPYHISNKGKNLEYPSNWSKLWENRPFLMFTNNLNGTYYKKHPVDYLYKEYLKLKS